MSIPYTPGPWEFSATAGNHDFAIYGNDGKDLALVRNFNEANARLMTASPDLLAALILIEARLTNAARAFYVDGTPKALAKALKDWKTDIEVARATIAAAQST